LGFGRYVALRVANMFVVLIIVTMIVAYLFTGYEQREAEAQLIDMLRQWDMSEEAQKLKKIGEEQYQKVRQQKIAEFKRKLGLDKTVLERIITRVRNVLTLDFGVSKEVQYAGTKKITAMMAKAIPFSMAMFTTATVINIIIGILLGAYIATHVGSIADRAVSILAMVGWSMPTWWLAMILILTLAVRHHIIPLPGGATLLTLLSQATNPLQRFGVFAYYLTGPILTLVIVAFGGWAWYTRNLLIGIFQEDYIMVARAKGVPERRVLYGHALRSAAPPFITMILASLVSSMWGGIISETVWQWPGMGLLYWMAIQSGDVPVLMALSFVGTFLTVAVYLTMDILYGVFDPRVRVGASGS